MKQVDPQAFNTERVRALYQVGSMLYPDLLLFTVMWTYMLLDGLADPRSAWWLLAVVLVALVRIVANSQRLKFGNFEKHAQRYEREYIAQVFVFTVVWCAGFATQTFEESGSYASLVVYIFTFMLMLRSAITTAASRTAYLVFFSITTLVLLADLLFYLDPEASLYHRSLARGTCLAALVLAFFQARSASNKLEEYLTNKLSNEILTKELAKANKKLEESALKDGLTEVGNRRAFDLQLVENWRRCWRSNSPCSLLMLDVDYCKPYNDNYGHPAGDEVLRQVATVLKRACLREDDLCFRYGGEEFVMLLPNTDQNGAVAVAKRVQTLLAEQAIEHKFSQVAEQLTVSIGVSSLLPSRELSASELVQRADQALYAAKKAGRNRYLSAGEQA